MKAILGAIGAILVLGGAGSSDCGADLIPSAITSLIGMGMVFLAINGGKSDV